jgi:hypothetical protein
MYRTPSQIRLDMLEWAKQNIYTRASDEWQYDAQDADPLVRLLVEACASEAKIMYESLEDSDNRLLKRLIQILLPEHHHLPQPSHAIAKALPVGDLCALSEASAFNFTSDDDSFHFSPAFDTNLLNAKLRFVGTDTSVSDVIERQTVGTPSEHVSRMLLGFELTKPLTSLHNIRFFTDFQGLPNEKSAFFQGMADSRWFLNKKELPKFNGFLKTENTGSLSDEFDPNMALKKKIHLIYRQNFISFDIPELIPGTEDVDFDPSVFPPTKDIVREWLSHNPMTATKAEQEGAKFEGVQGNFVWFEVLLPYYVRLKDLESRAFFSPHHFPIINRKLHIKDDSDTYFSRPMLEVVHLQTKDPMLGVRRVVNEDSAVDLEWQPLALLKNRPQLSYSLRYGGVGRMDNYNIWQRFAYLLSIFREEGRWREMIEKTGDNMSLEEFHEFLGTKIEKKDYLNALNPAQNVYVFINAGNNTKSLRVQVEYWTTQGENVKLPAQTLLKSEPVIPGLDPLSIKLVTATRGGQNVKTDSELMAALQGTLTRRGRIVTEEDVKSFCRESIGEELSKIEIKNGVEIDRRPNGGIKRVLEVWLHFTKPNTEGLDDICREIESSLQEQAVGIVPYRVKIANLSAVIE